MAMKINLNRKIEGEDDQFEYTLRDFSILFFISIAILLIIFVVLLCLGCTTSQAAWIVAIISIIGIIGVRGILIALSVIGVILLFSGNNLEQIVSATSSFLGSMF